MSIITNLIQPAIGMALCVTSLMMIPNERAIVFCIFGATLLLMSKDEK